MPPTTGDQSSGFNLVHAPHELSPCFLLILIHLLIGIDFSLDLETTTTPSIQKMITLYCWSSTSITSQTTKRNILYLYNQITHNLKELPLFQPSQELCVQCSIPAPGQLSCQRIYYSTLPILGYIEAALLNFPNYITFQTQPFHLHLQFWQEIQHLVHLIHYRYRYRITDFAISAIVYCNKDIWDQRQD